MTTNEIASKFKGRIKTQKGWKALCPSHDDKKPSLSIDAGAGNRTLLYCYAGCRLADILSTMRLKASDLFNDAQGRQPMTTGRISETPQEESFPFRENTAPQKEKTIYSYCEPDGTERFQVVRLIPKDFRFRRKEGNGFIWKLGNIKTIPYNLQRIEADKTRPIFITEGEKDTDCLTSLGLIASCNPGGAGNWKATYSPYFKGRDIIITPDNDRPGRDHAKDVSKKLDGIAASIIILELPGLEEKGDVSDFCEALRKKGMSDNEIVSRIETLAKNPPQMEREPGDESEQEETPILGMGAQSIADVVEEKLEWLWSGYLPKGTMVIFDGAPGVGKSTITIDIACRLSHGDKMPDGSLCEQGNSLLVTVEDHIPTVVKPRIIAAGGDENHMFYVPIKGIPRKDGTFSQPTLADTNAMREEIREKKIALMIIDPLAAFMPPDINSWKDTDIRKVLAPISAMAAETGVVVIVVRHTNKNTGSNAMNSGGGSIAIVANARAAFLVGKHPDIPGENIFAPIKFNLGIAPPAITYKIESKGNSSIIAWGATTTISADEIVTPKKESREEISALKEGMDFLREELKNGTVIAKRIYADAKGQGISERTLDRAKRNLGIISDKEPTQNGKWFWMLPPAKEEEQILTPKTLERIDTQKEEYLGRLI